MIVEALYRDNHKERYLLPETATLVEAVSNARVIYTAAPLKHLKVIPRDHRDRGRVDTRG